MPRAVVLVAIAVTLLSVNSVRAQTPEEKGLAIAKEVDFRDQGFGDSMNDTKMILRDKYGNERPRYIRNRTREQENDGDKTIVIFDNPGDVKGTAFLSFTHKIGPDDQWLYLPALKKVKRISSNNKAGSFMNSEFAFEDISSQEVEKYTYVYLREDEVEGIAVHVVESDPVDPKSGYSKLHNYIDAERYIPLKVEFYDRGGRMKKTLVIEEYNQYLDKHWRGHRWTMTNHQTGKVTVLEQSNFTFGNGFTDKDFDKNSLARVR